MKKIKLFCLVLVAIIGSLVIRTSAEITAGDTIILEGVVYKVPDAKNLIPNGNFTWGYESWKEANNTPMTSTNFSIILSGGGVKDRTYLVGKGNAGATAAGSLGTNWPIQKGKAYLFKYYVKYIKDTTKADGLEQYLKISTGDTYGTESNVLIASSKVGGKNKWALNEVAFVAKHQYVQAMFRWLAGNFAFDDFYMCQLDSLGMDLTSLKNAIKDAETLAALNYGGKAAFQTAIDAAKAKQATVKTPAELNAAILALDVAKKVYKLTQPATAAKPVDFTFAITNPGVNASGNNVQPEGWFVSFINGNTFTTTGQHYSGVTTNRYFDSWNGTVGNLIYTAKQVITGLPSGRYSVGAAARTSGLGSYIFADGKQKEIINNGSAGGSLTGGWNPTSVDTVIVSNGTLTIGAKTVKGWTGTWFSADDFTLTYYGEDAGSYNGVAGLSALKSDKGRFAPQFSPEITDYYLYLPGGTTSFTLTATPTVNVATVANAGAVTLSGNSGQRIVTVTSKDGKATQSFTINYMIETPVLKHSYTFADGTAKDVVGKAHGVISGTNAVIANGVYTSNADFITLPGDSINLGKYGAITLEAVISTTSKANTNYTMLAYFGAASGANSMWIQPTRSSTGGSRASTSTPFVDSKRVDDGLKHHLVSVLTYDSLYYYIDGAQMGKVAAPNMISRIVNTLAYLGKGGWSDPAWKGKIHEFNIFNGVMDATTVLNRSLGLPEDNFLRNLNVNNLQLSPAFHKDSLNYKVLAPKGTKKLAISAIPSFPTGIVTGAGEITLSGTTTTATITVASADAPTVKKTYTVKVTVDPAAVVKTHSYTFDDGTAKDVISGANGVLSGTKAVFKNGAIETNGDFVTLPGEKLALNNYGAITLEGYITAGNAINTAYTMLAYFGGASGANSLWIQPTRGGSNVVSQTEASGVALNGAELDEGLTHHVVTVLTLDTLYYYIDGNQIAKKATGADKISTISRQNAWFGKSGWNDPTWNGTIHEFNIYNGELSPAAIKANANAFFENKGIALASLGVDYYKDLYPRTFSPAVKHYGVVVPAGVAVLNVKAVPANSGAKVISGGGVIDISNPAGIDTIWIESKDATVKGYYILNYTHNSPLSLKHSYTFEDGTAKDVVGKANGTLVGGTIANGAYTASANGQYISLPADVIGINKYPSITTEMKIKAADNTNGLNVMTSYFGNTVGSYGTDYFFTSHKSRAAITCQMPAAPWAVETGVSGSKELDDAGYYHMVSTLTNDTISWYVNGELIGKAANSVANKIFNLSNKLAYLCKSGYTGDATWMGTIHEFNIYAGVMDAATIAKNANAFLITSNNTIEQNGSVRAYSNEGRFIISTPYTSGSVKIYNLTGKLVKSGTINSNTMSIPVETSGLYFIEVISGKDKTTIKALMK